MRQNLNRPILAKHKPHSAGAGFAARSGALLLEEGEMDLTSQRKRGLIWGLGILMVAILTSVAWAQIHAALAHCLLAK
jgi:hypothetical protein